MRVFWAHHVARYTRMMWVHDQWKAIQLMLRKMPITDFMLMFVVALLDREKQLWQRKPSENFSLSVLSIEHTHSEPGKDLIIPWGHDSSSDPLMTRTMVGNEDKADIADVHVAPSSSSGTQGGFCGMWRTSHSSDLPQIYNWSPSLFAGDFDLLSGYTSLP